MVAHGVLSRFYLFRGAPSDDLVAVEARAERRHYERAQLVFREGDEADAIYLVQIGTVEIVRAETGVAALAIVGSGGGFGEIAFFDRGRRPAAARTREPSELISIPFVALRCVLNDRAPLAAVFYRNASAAFARRCRRALDDLSFARERTARYA